MKDNIKSDKNLKKILVIGANGFLGTNLFRLTNNEKILYQNFNLIAADLDNSNLSSDISFHKIDITNYEQTNKKILKISPDIIILTAAMTNVDQCEVDQILATKINVEGTLNVVKSCKKIDSKLVFISTDFIFDGNKKRHDSYNESDIPNPLSYYAKTKYKAEMIIFSFGIQYLLCRTSVLYGWNKRRLNFITWVLNNLKQNNTISITTNQINSPTYVVNLAQIILKLIEKEANGIYNTAGDCTLNRYEMALLCAEIFEYNKKLISPIDYIEQKAIRPKNASLDITKLKNLIGSEFKIFNLHDGLIHMKNHKNLNN
ncbi:MAG: SDR family oxidoreductase [Candidatus Odinarchaeota archaeon]